MTLVYAILARKILEITFYLISLCLRKFHASARSGNTTNICTSSFLQAFRPVSDWSGVNAKRPGKFLFVCDECTTLNEIKNFQTTGDHIMHLKNEI